MKFRKSNTFATLIFIIIFGAIHPFLLFFIYHTGAGNYAAIAEADNLTFHMDQGMVLENNDLSLEPNLFNRTYASSTDDFAGTGLQVFDTAGIFMIPSQGGVFLKTLVEQLMGKSKDVATPHVDFVLRDQQTLYWCLMLFGLAVIVSYVTSRIIIGLFKIRILKPIIQNAHRLRNGDLSARVHAFYDDKDFGSLALIFDEMADAIEQRSKELELSNLKYRELFTQSPIGLFLFTQDGTILDANKACIDMMGFEKASNNELHNLDQVINDPKEKEYWIQAKSSRKGLVDHELRLVKANGQEIYTLISARAITSPDGTVEYYEGSLQDITDRKSYDALIQKLAFHDPLTGLLNRNALQEEMGRLKSRANRIGRKIAVYFIDLDNFKQINDQYGHNTGDNLLKIVATRIQANIRPEDILSRFGGDEFILVAEINQAEEALIIADRIKDCFKYPAKINTVTLQISLSIGICVYPDDAEDMEKLIHKADQAMYENKRNRKWRAQYQIASQISS